MRFDWCTRFDPKKNGRREVMRNSRWECEEECVYMSTRRITERVIMNKQNTSEKTQ